MSEENQPHARVTLNMLYQKQLENERLLIELSSKMAGLQQLPDRVRSLEMQVAKTYWIERVAYIALAAGLGSIITTFIGAA